MNGLFSRGDVSFPDQRRNIRKTPKQVSKPLRRFVQSEQKETAFIIDLVDSRQRNKRCGLYLKNAFGSLFFFHLVQRDRMAEVFPSPHLPFISILSSSDSLPKSRSNSNRRI